MKTTPQATFKSLLNCIQTLNSDYEARVSVARKNIRSLRAVIRKWETDLSKYEVKLAKLDEPDLNKTRWKIMEASLKRIGELSGPLSELDALPVCAFCGTSRRCIPLRRKRQSRTVLQVAA